MEDKCYGAGMLVWEIKMFDKCMCVKEQTEEYEKTLPAEYLEQKQAVEHYRDSLMHAKGRFDKCMYVQEQTEEYEKTLPAEYLEYKQAVEH